ncbi:EAL domain-containing protein [Halochromatium roseum]|uniref:EAL domain-containing protein n=1 Tax=Halochromatium roseum TaxID=391920 RepID=UPI0019129B30|nr:EAL domain-containing protein [Halochromatium roseum]
MLQREQDNSKQLPENLQRSQIALPALLGALDSLSTYLYTKDLEGRHTYANQLACQLWGAALHEVIGKTDLELFAPERCTEVIATDQRVLATGATIALEETLALPNQRPRTFWSVKAPLCDEQGGIIGLIGISTEITERKRAEQRAKIEQQRLARRVEERTEQLAAEVERHALTSDQLRLAIDGAELGVWEYHLRPERFFWSERCKRHLGLPAGEPPSYAGFMARIHPEDRARVQLLVERSLQTRQDYAAEYRLRWDDGSEHWISALGRVYCDAEGEPTHLAGITQDISARKQAEQRLFEREDAARRQLAEIQTYYDTAPIGLAVLDTELRYRRINERLAKSNGHPVAAHLGRGLREMVPDLAATLEPRLKQVIASGEPLRDQEIQIPSRDPACPPRFYLEHYHPLLGGDGEVIGINVVVEDISERRALEQQIRAFNADLERQVAARTAELQAAHDARLESEEKYRKLFNSAGDAIAVVDLEGNFVDINATACQQYGYDRETFLTLNVADLDVPEEADQIRQRLIQTHERGEYAFEARHRTADGRLLTVEVKGVAISVGGRAYLFGIWRDISERKRSEWVLRDAHQRVSELLDAMAAAVYVTDMETYDLVFMNETARVVWGDGAGRQCYEVLQGLASPCAFCTNDKLLDASGEPSGFYEWEHFNTQSQRWYALRDRALRWSDGRLVRVEIATDITAYKQALARIEHLAYHDSLTGLPNRLQFIERLGELTKADAQASSLVAICYLNVDDFKAINARDGRAFGDAVLIELAGRLRRAVHQAESVARMGSDEFALLLTELTTSAEAIDRARAIQRRVARVLSVEGQHLHLSVSLGLTLFPIDQAGPDALLQHAHEALFQAKRRGSAGYTLYDPIRDHRTRQQRRLYQEFAQALTQNQLVLHYQPKIRLADGQVHGLEALIRWQHPHKGLLRPDQFLPIIEDSPLEFALGEWLIHEALTQQARWREQGYQFLISVNISPRQLQERNFSVFLERALGLDAERSGARAGQLGTEPGGQQAGGQDGQQAGALDGEQIGERGTELIAVGSARLEIELLEIARLDDAVAAAAVMRDCKRLGVRFSLDDFGTGYASLTYFHQLPIDIVKIDRRFVLNMLDNAEDRAIVEGVLLMARTLPRPVLAEGVESFEIGLLLQQMGCEYAQGYGIARPMPAEHVLPWLSAWAKERRWHQ